MRWNYRYSLKQFLYIGIPLLSFLCWVFLILIAGWKQSRFLKEKFLESHEQILSNVAKISMASLRIQDFTEIKRNLLTLSHKNSTAILASIIDAGGVSIVGDYSYYGEYQTLLTQWLSLHAISEGFAGFHFKTGSEGYFVYSMPISDLESANRPIGSLVAFVSDRELQKELTQQIKMLFLTGVPLFLLQLSLLLLVTRSLVAPLERFIGEVLVAKEKDSQYCLELFRKVFHLKDINVLSRALFDMLDSQVKEAALGKIATQVAHDIRSPLSSMQAALGYLGNITIADPKATDVLNLLELSAKRLTGIADDLLKKHKGDGENNKIIFSLHHILDELVGEYQGREEYKDLRFVKAYASQAIQIYGDRAKLQRAFGNIIKNAVEAMENRGAITLSTAKPNGKVEVSITDTGPGIPADKLARILEGGFTEGKKDGHGIGTKVVKEVIMEFGGDITAKSELGKGTAFVIELPLPSVAENQSAQREKTAMESFTLELASDRELVLVVDDDAGLREQWRLILKDHGVETILCESYEDVIRQKIGSTLTQTAIIDYHFDNSEKSGAEVIQYLQGQGFKRLVLCTAEYWKPSVQKLTNDLNAKLCPKPLPKISFQVENVNRVDKGYKVLVIDDDEGIRLSWELLQEKRDIEKLFVFANLETLIVEKVNLKIVDIAFVDKNIDGSKYSGAEVVQYLKSRGVAKVVLASGESEKELRKNTALAQADFISSEKIPSSFKEFFS